MAFEPAMPPFTSPIADGQESGNVLVQAYTNAVPEELKRAKREIELLKSMDPFRAADMALEIQVERMRVVEATNARDAVVERLADACGSVRRKTAMIDALHQEKELLMRTIGLSKTNFAIVDENERLEVEKEIARLDDIVEGLADEMKSLSVDATKVKYPMDPPPRYEKEKIESVSKSVKILENDFGHEAEYSHPQLHRADSLRLPFRTLRDLSPVVPGDSASTMPETSAIASYQSPTPASTDFSFSPQVMQFNEQTKSDEPEDMINARHAILASLPIPFDIPEDSLKPILIPAPFTLHEFLGNAPGVLRTSLASYRVFQQLTTSWCPDREEHGYMLTPVFKCNTNPRVATAHRWTAVDPLGKMSTPTECFYTKDGKWYYAGIYKAFRLDDLTTKEWEALSTETSQTLIKDTIAGRKNTSPQNLYETSQLFAAGALKVACVGLQCVGFNNTMYRAILEHAKICEISGKWRCGEISPSPALGPGVLWNANVGMADMAARGGEFHGHDEGWKSMAEADVMGMGRVG